MERVLRKIGKQKAACAGLTGKGVGVAVLDTGICPHPDFGARIKVFRDFLKNKKEPYDDNGHGTHVCGIISGSGALSDGRISGVAPGCHLVVCKVLDQRGNGSVGNMVAGLQWLAEHYLEHDVRIVNISVGALPKKGSGENSLLIRNVNRLWDLGLVVVAAAGNQGPAVGSVTTPGISRKVITVGCSDDEKPVMVLGNRLVHYSGRGPTEACLVKPEVVAPGYRISACGRYHQPGGSSYEVKSGTSMSTPVVSGAIALLLQKCPGLTNAQVKLRLRESCLDLGLERSHQGWGQLWLPELLKEQKGDSAALI